MFLKLLLLLLTIALLSSMKVINISVNLDKINELRGISNTSSNEETIEKELSEFIEEDQLKSSTSINDLNFDYEDVLLCIRLQLFSLRVQGHWAQTAIKRSIVNSQKTPRNPCIPSTIETIKRVLVIEII